MNLSGTRVGTRAQSAEASGTRLHGRWLVMARTLWGVLVALTLVYLVLSLPGYPSLLANMQTPCTGSQCNGIVLSPQGLATLHSFGLTAFDYALFSLLLFAVIPFLGWIALGGIIIWRKSDDWMALLVAFTLILWGVEFATGFGALEAHIPALLVPGMVITFAAQTLIILVLCLFPNGRLAPRWMLAPLVAWILFSAIHIFFPFLPLVNQSPGFILAVLALVCIVVALIYRYRYVFTPTERQQTKWLIFALAFDVLVFWIGWNVLGLFIPAFGQSGSLLNSLNSVIWAISFLSIPISIGIALLRYRLWDIDVIIRRTLIYGSLTALLALLYFGLIFALQFLFQGIFHQNNAVIIVISTLAIAALFHPLRRRIQAIIDHRFYRRKYDAARTVEAFSATLRDEVDLSQLSEQLVAVVQETMQPAQVSLWLRSSERRDSSQGREVNRQIRQGGVE